MSFIWDEVGQFLGLDPLAKSYGPLGASEQPMVYIHSPIEGISSCFIAFGSPNFILPDMPFPDASIDVVTSINSFDHVVNPSRGLGEVFRVLRPGGSFLLIVEMKVCIFCLEIFRHAPTDIDHIGQGNCLRTCSHSQRHSGRYETAGI